jgi:hypothetical protein
MMSVLRRGISLQGPMHGALQRSLLEAPAAQQTWVRFFGAGKPKPHKGVQKRFRLTASGRVKYAK